MRYMNRDLSGLINFFYHNPFSFGHVCRAGFELVRKRMEIQAAVTTISSNLMMLAMRLLFLWFVRRVLNGGWG